MTSKSITMTDNLQEYARLWLQCNLATDWCASSASVEISQNKHIHPVLSEVFKILEPTFQVRLILSLSLISCLERPDSLTEQLTTIRKVALNSQDEIVRAAAAMFGDISPSTGFETLSKVFPEIKTTAHDLVDHLNGMQEPIGCYPAIESFLHPAVRAAPYPLHVSNPKHFQARGDPAVMPFKKVGS
uniref:Uncharacterized protein n=1 Tax=Polytomella parva TaxID=51329 RepID=A0A7S0YFF6_9CHLO